MKTLLDLANNECRWPLTRDKPFRFCAEPKLAGSSYCACHKPMSVRADQPKRGSVPGGFVLPKFVRAGSRRSAGGEQSALLQHRTPVDVHMRRSLETATILQEAGE